ncbi:MAG: hypothetical protein U0869_01460 [Chloroflexota bacterium]
MQRTNARALVGATAVAMLALAMLAPATMAAGKGGDHKKDHPKQAATQLYCKKGHWKDYKRADDTRFKNQGRCVSYVVHGNTPVALAPAVTIGFALKEGTEASPVCVATGYVEDLARRSDQSATLSVDSVAQTPTPFTTDKDGDAVLALGEFAPGQTLNLSVGALASGDVLLPAGCVVTPI